MLNIKYYPITPLTKKVVYLNQPLEIYAHKDRAYFNTRTYKPLKRPHLLTLFNPNRNKTALIMKT